MIVGALKNRVEISIITLSVVFFSLFISLFSISHSFYEISDIQSSLFNKFVFNEMQHASIPYLIVCSVLILVGAFLLAVISINNELIAKGNLIPSLLYILFSFSAITHSQLQPILIANLFIMFSLQFLFSAYRNENSLLELFYAGFLIALGSCFYINYIFIFPIGIIALFILKSFNWREWIVFLIGVFTPFYFYAGIAYVSNKNYWQSINLILSSASQFQKPIFSEFFLIFILSLVLLFTLSLFHYLNKGFGSKIKTQKAKYIIIWLSIFCGIISFINSSSSNMFLFPCAIPFSIIIGDYIEQLKKLKIANTLLTIVMVGFLIIYFHNLNMI